VPLTVMESSGAEAIRPRPRTADRVGWAINPVASRVALRRPAAAGSPSPARLVHDPKLIVCDEPTSAWTEDKANKVRSCLRDVATEEDRRC